MDDQENSSTPRRSSRPKKLSAKAAEIAAAKAALDEIESTEDDSSAEEFQRPSVLHENELLSGGKIFTLKAKKKCEAVLNEPKTPHSLRNRIKKNIVSKIIEENESSSEHDFSDSGSEFEISHSEEEASEEESDSDSEAPPKRKVVEHKQSNIVKRGNRHYAIKSDDYFSNHSNTKIVTSNHTLDKLETPRLPQDQLHKLLTRVKLSDEHSTQTNNLIRFSEVHFNKWMYLMHEDVNILVYGLGSKRDILNSFHEKHLKKLPSIIINGFFPSITIKDVLDGIIISLLELKENPANVYEACDLIEREFHQIAETHLYLIIHNIDMIKGAKAQSVFARLAAIPNIHLIASIDHINAPLIWDHSKLSKFNFTWWDVTTFQHYLDETSFESSMMVQRTGTLALSSLRNVFLSLTSKSKGIYLILVKYQIENGNKQYYQGLAFKDLYTSCREAFLVSSDLALRTQLTEFLDHKMVKFKRSLDGIEYLVIPIANSVLQQFLSENP